MKRLTVTALAGAGAFVLLGGAPALAAPSDLTVGSCGGADYSTIQAAVDAARPSAHINVCPGTYSEQLNIPAGKGNLVLKGQGDKTVIQYPSSGESASGPDGADAVVAMSPGARDSYQLTDFVIQGPWSDASNGRHFGVFVTGAGSAQISNDTVRNIVDCDVSAQSDYDGFAVAIGDSSLFDDGPELPGNATISNSTISNYQTLGVTVSVAGSTGTINNDTIQGLTGGSPHGFLVGVVAGDGASADVHNNTISGNYDGTAEGDEDSTQGVGIFAGFAPGSVTLHNNVLTGNDIGLEIQGASGVVDHNDQMVKNNYDGIHIDAADPFGDRTSGNTLSNDRVAANGAYDCQDDTAGSGTAGTANTWSRDQGATMTPTGICQSVASPRARRPRREPRPA